MADDKEVSQPILAFKDSLDEFIKQKDENSKETIAHQAQSLYYADESLRTQKEDFNSRKESADKDNKNSEKSIELQAQSLYYADESLRTQKADFEAAQGNKSADKAKTQTNKAQQDRLVKGLKNIGSGIKGLLKKASDFAGETPSAIKALLTGGAFFLLAKFLQSDFAQNVVFKIYMRLKKLGKDIMEFDFSFMGLYNIIKDNFLTIVGILAVFKPKLLFNIIKGSLFGLAKVIDSFGKETTKATQQTKMGKVFGKLKGSFAGLKKGIGRVTSRITEESKKGIGKGTFDTFLRKKFSGAGAAIKGSIGRMTGGLKGAFKALGKLSLKNTAMLLTQGITAMLKFIGRLAMLLITPFKILGGVLLANPIALTIAIIVGIFIYIGKKLGIFKKLGNFLSSLFDKIVNGFRSLYNYFANSFVGKSLGLTPISDEATGDPKQGKDTVKESGKTGTEFEGDEDSSSDIEPELTPEQKKQAAFDITSNALDKMVSMMGASKGQNQQININNSKNNNSKSVTTANVAIDDNSPVIQSLKGQATA